MPKLVLHLVLVSLLVMGGDSIPSGCEFKSQRQILPRWIVIYICLL